GRARIDGESEHRSTVRPDAAPHVDVAAGNAGEKNRADGENGDTNESASKKGQLFPLLVMNPEQKTSAARGLHWSERSRPRSLPDEGEFLIFHSFPSTPRGPWCAVTGERAHQISLNPNL